MRLLGACTLVVAAAIGCAQGFSSEPERMIEPPSPPEPPVFTGEACEFGDRVACECTDGKSMGVRACVPSETSPTKGMLSECVACSEISSSNASAGASARTGAMSSAQTASSIQAGRGTDAGRSGRGSAGQGGSAGKSVVSITGGGASSSGSSAVSGSGGKSGQGGAGGSGGSGGSGGAGGSRAGTGGASAAGSGGRGEVCNCNSGCLLFGVFPCCRTNGSCGCSWAPGAYCM